MTNVNKCDCGLIEIKYDVYNGTNVKRAIKEITIYSKSGSFHPLRIGYEEGNLTQVRNLRSNTFFLEPRSTKHLEVSVRLTKKSLKAHYKSDSELLFGYRTEEDRLTHVAIAKVRDLENFPLVQLGSGQSDAVANRRKAKPNRARRTRPIKVGKSA